MSHENLQLSADRLPRRLLPWLIWGIGTSFVLFQFLLQLSSGVLVERLMHDFSMTALTAGLMSGAYYYVYVVLQTPAGMLIDRFGARLILSVGALVCALGCGLFTVSHTIWAADVGRVLMGSGSAFAFVGTLYLIGNWFPAAYFGMMLGLSDLIATVATIGANVYLARLIEQTGWRSTMAGATALAMVIAMLSWVIIRNRPADAPAPPRESVKKFRQHAVAVIKSPLLWLNGLFNGVLFSIVSVFSGMWGVPFIGLVYKISISQATTVSSMLFVGLAIGCPTIGFFYPRLRRHLRTIFVAVSLMLSLLLSWIIYMPSSSVVMFGAIMVMIGLLCCVYVLSFAYVKEIIPAAVQSTAMGFTNALCVGTVPVFQPLIGYLLHVSARWRHGASAVDFYDVIDYQFALSVLPISLVGAAVLAWFIFYKRAERTDQTFAAQMGS